MTSTILWHDYETWGVQAKYDFPVQFAAIRTDLEFNQVGKEINIHCQIPNDYLPHPEACLVTGISPQQSIRDGFLEHEFASKIHSHMMQSGTCVVGYNSIKFDDEVTRHLLYRNFYPVYEREYLNGNSRWDIIDLVRAAYALRPEGIEWPIYDSGLPCFKLEKLCEANGLAHEHAHDALSDVRASIALAKLIKSKQTKLYDFYWQLRDKNRVMQTINVQQQKPFLYISGLISSEHGCTTWMMPICMHPSNRNVVLAVDLSKDISVLRNHTAAQLSDNDFIRSLYETRTMPVMQVAINKVPFVAPAKMLNEENAEHLHINREKCLAHYHELQNLSDLAIKCQSLFSAERDQNEALDIDAQLYTRDFPGPADKQLMERIRQSAPEALGALYSGIENPLYKRQVFRYIGRNFPNVMSQNELERWQAHRTERFINGSDKHYLNLEQFNHKIASLLDTYGHDKKQVRVLHELARYASEL